MALIGLYAGSYILKHKNKRGFKLGRSRQTAKMAYNAIMKKYKVVKPGSKYHHVGNGVWRIYSIANDRKKTGKLTEDKKKWAKRPHKLDYMGVDTSGACPTKKPSDEQSRKIFISKDIKKRALNKAIEEYETYLAINTRWPRKFDKEFTINEISSFIRNEGLLTPKKEYRKEYREQGDLFKLCLKKRDEYAKAALSEAIKLTPKSKFDIEEWKMKQK